MKVPEKVWVNYIESLAKVSREAADKMRKYLETYDLEAEQWRNAIITTAHAFAVKYGEAAASLACDMYDAMAEASGWTVPPAEPAETATMEETAKAVNGTLKQYLDVMQVAETVGRLVKTTGQDTTLKNAERDGAQFAWIPHGDTCPFCMILASRGWQYMSKQALKNGHAEHIHPHCDCAYGIRFDSSTTYDGYDPDKYLQIYEDAEGDTWKEKMNYMRREQHAQEKAAISMQKLETQADRMDNKISDGAKYIDRTKEWVASFEKNTPLVIDAQEYTDENGVNYKIDGKNVFLEYDNDEYETGQLLSRATGEKVQMCPVVRGKIRGVSTPDFLVGENKERWDRKGLLGAGKDAIRDNIKSKKAQADHFVIDVTNWKGDMSDIFTQAEMVFKANNTEFVKALVITSNGKVVKVMERK